MVNQHAVTIGQELKKACRLHHNLHQSPDLFSSPAELGAAVEAHAEETLKVIREMAQSLLDNVDQLLAARQPTSTSTPAVTATFVPESLVAAILVGLAQGKSQSDIEAELGFQWAMVETALARRAGSTELTAIRDYAKRLYGALQVGIVLIQPVAKPPAPIAEPAVEPASISDPFLDGAVEERGAEAHVATSEAEAVILETGLDPSEMTIDELDEALKRATSELEPVIVPVSVQEIGPSGTGELTDVAEDSHVYHGPPHVPTSELFMPAMAGGAK